MTSFNGGNTDMDIFSRIRNHEGRDVITSRRKFQWRYATLKSDFQELVTLGNLPAVPTNDANENIRQEGYVFEIERRLHHYLSGLYTFLEIHQTIQEGVGEKYREKISNIEDEYRGAESSRTLLGMRHYVQHENVLPLQPYSSSIDRESKLVILLNDLEKPEGYHDGFEAHYGHLDKAYCIPINEVKKNWPHVQELFESTISILMEEFEIELEEYSNLIESVESLTEEIHQELLSEVPFDDDFSPSYDSGE
jgi:hypothetical protein